MTTKPLNDTQKLDALIRARYPMVGIRTPEEGVVREALIAYAEANGRSLFEWSIVGGLKETVSNSDGKIELPAKSTDPVAALKFVLDRVRSQIDAKIKTRDSADSMTSLQIGTMRRLAEHKSLWVFYDVLSVVRVIGNTTDAPTLVRVLRELVTECQRAPATVVLVGVDFPQIGDLSSDIEFMDWSLPDEAELSVRTDRFIATRRADDLKKNRETVKLTKSDAEDLVRSLKGLTRRQASDVLGLTVATTGLLDRSALEFVRETKRSVISRSGIVEYMEPRFGIDDVVGLDNVKQYVAEAKAAFTPRAAEIGIKPPRGLLLVGIPGCGKSMIAEAIASDFGFPLIRNDIGQLKSGIVGSSNANVRSLFRLLRGLGLSVALVDEVEKGFAGVGGGDLSGVSKEIFGTYLTGMEELYRDGVGTFWTITSNDPDTIPSEFFRRVDNIFWVDLPTQAERVAILSMYTKTAPLGRGFSKSLESLANDLGGYTPAEIEKVAQKAMRGMLARDHTTLTADHVRSAMMSVKPLSQTKGAELDLLRERWADRAIPASNPEPIAVTISSGRMPERIPED